MNLYVSAQSIIARSSRGGYWCALFTTPSGTLLASITGVNPGALSSITLNGMALAPRTGEFSVPVSLSEGQNTFTLVATDNQQRSAQATATVYLDSVPPVVTITAPADNSTVSTVRTDVSGTFTETSLKSISVNGVPAFISGNSWLARNVPLLTGTNTITATAEDIAGNTATASITLNGADNLADPVQLAATPVGGFAPLNVIFTPQSSGPGTLQQVLYDFDGDGVIDQTAADLTPVAHTYPSAGQFFPVVTLVTTAGRFSSPGGWNASDPTALRINVQAPPQQIGDAISVTDPVDLKTTADGKLYVLSRSTATILEYDTTTTPATLVRSASGIGTTPTGLDVDANGNVYVALSGENHVAKFNPITGTFQPDTAFGAGGLIGATGSGDGQFNAPYDVAVTPDGGEIAVSDSGNHRIQRFSTGNGSFVGSFGGQGSGLGQFNTPKGLTFDGRGYLYIVDSANNRIALAFDSMVVGTSGTQGTGLGQFQSPVNLNTAS
jgi:Glucodextranase, domain B/NHL repeat